MVFYGTITDGLLDVPTRREIAAHIAGRRNGRVQVELKRVSTRRTLDQNAYYWACLKIAGDSLGYETEDLHRTFASMFLVDRSGKLPIVRSTTDLTTVEFMTYLAAIARQCAELGVIMPEPAR
ncbi:MAG: hypothetical protein GY851_35435 [bacterium]|nr:hypothetical protein [bacterium]